jgi:hypothetical protein
MVKVGIVGYRNMKDYDLFTKSIDNAIEKYEELQDSWDLIVSGGAPGADTLAEKYSNDNNIPLKVFPADWVTYGSPKAAHIRNQQIVDESDFIIAFVHSESRGTWDTINRTKKTDNGLCIVNIN